MLCVLIVNISGGIYSLKSTPNDKFFEKLFIAILFTLRVFARNLLRGNRWRNTFRTSFWCLACDSNPGFSSEKPTHYLLNHGVFYYYYYFYCTSVPPLNRFLYPGRPYACLFNGDTSWEVLSLPNMLRVFIIEILVD